MVSVEVFVLRHAQLETFALNLDLAWAAESKQAKIFIFVFYESSSKITRVIRYAKTQVTLNTINHI